MMQYCLFDDVFRNELLPLTFTKPVSELRIGILTIREKWERYLGNDICSWKTKDYLSFKFPFQGNGSIVYLSGHVCPTLSLIQQVINLDENQGISYENRVVAVRTSDREPTFEINAFSGIKWIQCEEKLILLSNSWDLFSCNGEQIHADFDLITKGRISDPIPSSCFVQNSENVFVEKCAKITFASLNASTGPIYIGADTEIMEGVMIRGPFVLGKHSVVNMVQKYMAR